MSSVFDRTLVDEMRMLFPGGLREILREFAATMAADLDRVETALAEHRPQRLAAAAHSIRGTAQLIGSDDLLEAATAVERAAAAAGCGAQLDADAAGTLRRHTTATLHALHAHIACQERIHPAGGRSMAAATGKVGATR